MCINPRRIINKGYRPLDIKTSQFIDVGCGHCIQCKSSRQASYAYRMQQEVFTHPDAIPFFVTFTYHPYYRPVLYYFDLDRNIKSVSCWNKQHLQRFHKVLRRQLQYYYGVDKDSFKYLSCCERGSDREYIDDHGRYRVAQECPHYHNFYLVYNAKSLQPVRKLPDGFYEFVRQNNCGVNFRNFFHYLLQSRWYYGHIEDLEVTRSVATCTRYIAKYCSKNLSETVLNIPLSLIYRLVDNDFTDRYKAWESFNLDKVNSGNLNLVRKAPKPIEFSSLVPSPMSSNNIGFSFDPDSLHSYVKVLSSDDTLVTLVGSKKSSKIPLPYYYYKKICKKSGFVKDNIYYPYHDGIKESIRFSDTENLYLVECWNNMDGYYTDYRHHIYTMSWFTQIGEFVRHKQYKSRISRSICELKTILFNPSYFSDLVCKFNNLESSIRNGFSHLYHDDYYLSIALNWLKSNVSRLRVLLPRFFHLSFRELSDLTDPDMFNINVLLNTFRLCRTTFSYLNQIAYRKFFESKLNRVALHDPELFLPHFINLVK